VSESVDRETEAPERAALARLEVVVGKLLDEVMELKEQLHRSQTRTSELSALLEGLQKGEADPVRLQDRVRELEEENEDLKARLGKGREGIHRLLARIRFLEEQR
jgi:predicted RNase H-like nuclease (RuvC/YqgF family)